MNRILLNLKRWAKQLKTQLIILHLVMKHPMTPLLAKIIGTFTIIYALSPIDLIPDFIPILGYLDDLIIVPVGIWITIRLIPKEIWDECTEQAKLEKNKLPKSWKGLLIVGVIWGLSAWFCYHLIF